MKRLIIIGAALACVIVSCGESTPTGGVQATATADQGATSAATTAVPTAAQTATRVPKRG